MEKIPLAVAIITKNEEENIRSCLQNISFAGQIVVVDSGSTDKTLEIAAEFGITPEKAARWRNRGVGKGRNTETVSQCSGTADGGVIFL